MPLPGGIAPQTASASLPPRSPALPGAGPAEPAWRTAGLGSHRPARQFARADGMRIWDVAGREVLDAVSGAFVSPAGHCRTSVAQAVGQQLAEFDDAGMTGAGHPAAQEAVQHLAAIAPDGTGHVHFTASAREAMELALRCCLATHAARGETHRKIIVGDLNSNDGLTLTTAPFYVAGAHPGGHGPRRNATDAGLAAAALVRLPRPRLPAHRFVKGQPEYSAEWLDDVRRLLDVLGPYHVAACVVEPVSISSGMLVPPQGYLEGLRALCAQYGILLVFDETACGIGHTGAAFGAQSLGVTPDVLVAGHGLTNGALPLGAVLIGESLWPALAEAAHIYPDEAWLPGMAAITPAAHAAAAAMLRLCDDDALFDHAAQLSPHFLTEIFALSDLSVLSDIRGFGLMAGLEIDTHHAHARYAVTSTTSLK